MINHHKKGPQDTVGTAVEGCDIDPFWLPPQTSHDASNLKWLGDWRPGAGAFENQTQRSLSPDELQLPPQISKSTVGGTKGFRQPGLQEFARWPQRCWGAQAVSRPSEASAQEATWKTKHCGLSPRLKSTASPLPPPPLPHLRAIAFLQINRQ